MNKKKAGQTTESSASGAESGKADAKKAKKRAKPKKKIDRSLFVIYLLIGVLAAALLIFGTVMAVRAIRNAYLDSGRGFRNDVIQNTEHHEINCAMLSYRFYDAFWNGAFGDAYDDPEKMKNVESTVSGMSLYDYNLNSLLLSLQSTLYYAEGATQNGLSLDDRDRASVANRLKAIENSAAASGMELEDYLFAFYGRGVRLSDAEDLLTLEKLAEKMWSAHEISSAVTDGEIDDYLKDADMKKYLRFDFYIVNLDVGINDSDSEVVKAEKTQIAFDRANRLAQSSSLEEFRALAREFLASAYKDGMNCSDSEAYDAADEALASDRFVARQLRSPGEDEPESTKWLYSAARKAGDVFVDSDSPAVYFIERAAYSIDEPNDAFLVLSVNFNDYSSTSDATKRFEELKAIYESGSKTEQDFRLLVRTYDQTPAMAARDGFYDNTASPGAFNELIENKRTALSKNGDGFEVGQTYEIYGQNGIYLLFYLGKGDLLSRVDAREALIDQKCSKLYTEMVKSIRFTYNDPGSKKDSDRIAPLYEDD